VTGVEVETGGAVETIDASRVVLSAGSIQTPAILIRSGVGPKDTLGRLGVSIVKDAAGVGARLWDHPAALVVLAPKPGLAAEDQPMIQTTLRYTASGSDDLNDMQIEPLSFLQRLDGGGGVLVGLAPVIEKTRGHGRLVFHSVEPDAQPAIEPDFLNDPWDCERLVEGMELALRMADTPEIRAVAESVIVPKPEIAGDRQALTEWLRRRTGSGYHPCGTAPIGSTDDPIAVADQYGRVYGVEGLFVADASIMPTIPRANINVPTLMIGERFGEWFREDAI
jgi:choline dehydrogenase